MERVGPGAGRGGGEGDEEVGNSRKSRRDEGEEGEAERIKEERRK